MLSPQLTQSDDTVATSQEELSDFALTQILTEYSNEGGIYVLYTKFINHLLDYF